MRKPWLLNLLLLAALAVFTLRLSRYLQEPLPPLPAPPASEAPASPGEGAGEGTEEGADEEAAAPGEPPGGAEGGAGFDVIVARDLFSPTRGVVPPKPAAADARPAPKPAPQPKLTLYGVVIVEGERAAYLQEGTGDAKPRRVREGEAIAGATVKSIRPDGVTLSWAGGEMTVALRSPKEGAGGAPQPAGRPGGQPVPQPDTFPRRFPQPGRAGQAGAQPGVPVPGVPRLLPPAVDEEEFEDEGIAEDDEEFLEEDSDDDGNGVEEE